VTSGDRRRPGRRQTPDSPTAAVMPSVRSA
jgi:hypothetical protein